MPRKPAKPKTITFNSVKSAMNILGIYKPQFDRIISVYVQLNSQYDALTERFAKTGFECEVATATGSKKAPIVLTLESYRKDIKAYAETLGLTPGGLLKTNDKAFTKKALSALESAMKDAFNDTT